MKSASLHYNEAQYFTGYCYETGLGTQQSLENARIWYYKASRNGHRKAQERLHELNGESLQEMRREQLTKSNGSIDRKSNNTKSTHNKNNHWINKVKLLIVRLIAIIGCIITLLGIIVLFSILLSNIK